MTCVICIAAWSLNTHQIWSQSAEPFLSYSSAANFDTLHAARATCHSGYPDGWVLIPFTAEGMQLPIKKDRLSIRPVVAEIYLVKSVTWGRAVSSWALHTQFCPLFTKELRSTTRAARNTDFMYVYYIEPAPYITGILYIDFPEICTSNVHHALKFFISSPSTTRGFISA